MRREAAWSGNSEAEAMNSSGDEDKMTLEQSTDSSCSSLITTKVSALASTSAISHSRHQTVLLICFLVATLTLLISPVEAGIDCFKCVSLNGDNPSCEDPFHNNYSTSILESPCMGGRKGRDGLFPATACIKLAGKYADTGESMIVRTCAVDSGTLTLDTELARMSHCGSFVFEDRYVKGCLQSCDDADGCNGGSRPKFSLLILSSTQLTIMFCAYFWSKIL